MVYGDGLENRCSRKGTVGSNPTPSATNEPFTQGSIETLFNIAEPRGFRVYPLT